MTSCQHILDGHFDHGDVTEVIEFNGIILMRCISCVILFALILKNKYRASREDGRRAMLLLLPSYYPVIGFVIFYYFLFALLHIFIRGYGRYLVLVALDVAINHAMGVGLSFFLMQHGAGVYAFQRSLLFALAFCMLGFFAFYFIAKSSSGQRHDDHSHVSQRSYFAHIIFSCLILAFYSLVTFLPREYLYRRPAIYKYAKYCIVENFVWIVASSLMYVEHNAGYCALLSSKVILVSILHPVFFVHCLAKDSEFWQGCYVPLGDQSPVHDTWDLNLASASTIGTVLSDMQRSAKSLPVIHFSSIEFNVKKSFIAGGLSRVYFGKYNQREVAIKVLFAIELTPQVVTEFYKEVEVMYMLSDENVVQCLGISVMPPTICVILEYCHHGSLYDFIRNGSHECSYTTAVYCDAGRSESLDPPRGANTMSLRVKKQDNKDDEIELSLQGNPLHATGDWSSVEGGSRTISSSSAQSAGLAHTSIPRNRPISLFKRISARFSSRGVVSLPASQLHSNPSGSNKELRRQALLNQYKLMLGASRGVAFLHSMGFMHCDIKSPNFLISKDHVVKLADLGEARAVGKQYSNLPFAAYNWAPPELLNPDVSERFYTEASDVYGLSMVFSEILTGKLPLAELFASSSEDVIFHILTVENRRPLLPTDLPPALTSLVTRAWDSQASLRPSAQEATTILENVIASAEKD